MIQPLCLVRLPVWILYYSKKRDIDSLINSRLRKRNSFHEKLMDLSRELTRGGVRGGREQFKWDSLKSMSTKEREHYLGSIVHVGVPGKFGQTNKHDWWKGDSKSSQSSNSVADEKSRLKAMEAELMQEALGLKPKRLMVSKNRLSSDQVEDILKKEEHTERTEDDQQKRGTASSSFAADAEEESATQVRGFGYRKYIKENDWNAEPEVENLDGPEEVIHIKRESNLTIKREPTNATVKTEPVESPSRRNRQRSRSPYVSRRH